MAMPAAKLDLAQLQQLIEAGEIDTVIVAFPDMQGRLIGKRVTGHFFLDSVVEETHACNYLLACDMEMEPVPGYRAASWDLGYGDFVLRPDANTIRRIPWLEGTALVIADVTDEEGRDLPHSPRGILKRQLARIAERSWMANMASELEFYVFDETYESARAKGYRGLDHAGWYIEDYHVFQTSKEEPLIRAIRNHMDAAAIPVEVSKGEWGPGQEEINFRYAEALEMADRHVIYKNGAKEIAHQHGKALTFMAKPDTDLAGSSCHIHASLWDATGRQALFHDPAGEHGMSDTFRHFLAGLLALAQDFTYLLAPAINSYKRFQSASFAPTKCAWSLDNRTAGFRVVGHGKATRVECRIAGADANPYLAYAGMIAAGLHGIDRKLELPEPFVGNVYESRRTKDVPGSLREALERFRRSTPLKEALGEPVVDHYLHAGRWELAEQDRLVSDLDLRRMFERG